MKILDLRGRTRAIGAPLNWDPATDGECSALPVRDGLSRGLRTMTSAWMPSEEDLRFLNLGLPILLTVFGHNHPVVSIGVGQPSDLPEAGEKVDV